jgi:predicted AAA+ superfamily ATPase
MITRDITTEIIKASEEYPVVTVFGPRQSGKTTLVQMSFPDKAYYSLEDPDVRLAAEMDPRGFLAQLKDGGTLDEIQRLPQLLSYIQGIVDKTGQPSKFILTGSHQPDLHQAITQSLAGRTAVLTLLPFSLNELHNYHKEWQPYKLIVKGSFPRLHHRKLQHERFFNGYFQTYVERDVRALINLKDLSRFQQFMILLAGRIGQVINYSSLSNDIGVSATTIKNWLSVLKASYVVFELPPFETGGKVSKDLFYRHGTCLVSSWHPDRLSGRQGSITRRALCELYFFRDSHGNEVDLLIREERKLLPVEIKSSATFSPDFLKGIKMFNNLVGTRGEHGMVVYNGEQNLNVHGVRVFNPLRVSSDTEKLFSY